MKIKGLQKTTLVDYPGKIACTIFLYGCNFRCGFCHNPELVVSDDGNVFSEEYVLDFLDKRKKYLEGVCFTGGEPLATLDKDFLRKVKSFGYLIKIDTNGSFPSRLREFIDDGLVDFVAMDLKTCKEDYSKVANADVDLEKIEESIKLVCSLENYEFRTTVLGRFHDEEKIKRLGEWVNSVCGGKPKKYVLQGFKNSGKFIDEDFAREKNVSEKFLFKLKRVAGDFFEGVGVRV